jgi:hypothetical protein
MRLSGRLVCFFLFTASYAFPQDKVPQDKGQPPKPPVTLPTSPVPTIPSDAMFTIGQQNGKIDDMTKRIDGLEADVKDVSKDVGKLNVYATLIGGFIVLVIAPLIYEWAKRHFFKDVARMSR